MTKRLFTALCGLVFLVNFGRVAFAPLVPEFQQDLGISAAAVGSVTTLVWIGTAAPRIPIGWVLTRVARERVVLATGLALSAAAALTATADSLLALRIGAFAVGLATGGYFVAAIPLIGALYPERTGRAVGVHGTASQVASVVAPALALAAIARVGDWRAVFWLLAGGALVVTVALFAVVRARGGVEPEGDAAATDGDGVADAEPRSFLAALSHWRIVLAGMSLVAVAGFAWQGVFNFYVSYLLSKGLTPANANLLLTVAFAAGVPAFWLGGRLADRLPKVPYLLALNAAFVASLVALTYAGSLAAFAVVSAALGYAAHALFPAVDTYMLSTLPAADRASAYAVFSGASLLFEANGSGVVGALTDAGVAFDRVFRLFAVAVAAVLVLAALLYVLGRFPAPLGSTRRQPDGR
ncbi:MFS transporter [Halobaculum magnesiiphilum]|uniref:MFS transporter n=1 Tax=Halobaculum magnesiiphilum TaxID=1017351 RepID=A0A8T8WF88_9EURY|nr:MFS transporter [Halobaculum magnesiiphilum]QZP38518.1 MFS transporter [Halobaculum magnesiiphilum]